MKLIAAHCSDISMDDGLIDGRGPVGAHTLIPVMSFFIETSAGIVVWDTGMAPIVAEDPVKHWGKMAKRNVIPQISKRGNTVSRLHDAGYEIEDVAAAVNSHLHVDHTGMNASFLSRLHIRERELKYALAQDGPGWRRAEFDFSEPDIVLFDYEDEFDFVVPGALRLLSFPGHTPGHQCLLVTFPSGKEFLLTGDAVYTNDQVDQGSGPGLGWDDELASESARRLRKMKQDGVEILVGHDPDTWKGFGPVSVIHAEP